MGVTVNAGPTPLTGRLLCDAGNAGDKGAFAAAAARWCCSETFF